MNLLKVRSLLKLTQDELAKRIGYSQTYISMIELRKRNATKKFKTKMETLIIKMRGKEARIEKMHRTGRLTSKW